LVAVANPVSGRGGTRGPQQSFGDLDKPLYTISVAAEILETHPRTLMLYEDAGLIEPYRTSTNRRRYSQRDISKVQVIQHLTREKGVTLAGVRHILSLFETMKKHHVEPPVDLREVFDRYSQII
jgi:MerR family transcriptional regulator, heat shock protein HspR